MTACFPAIIPGTGVGEDTRLADRRGWSCEVLGGREPFVGEGQDAAAKGFVDEVLRANRSAVIEQYYTSRNEYLCYRI